MKPSKLPILLLFIFIYSSVQSDIILTKDYVRINTFFKLTNPDEFPEYTIVGFKNLKIGKPAPVPFQIKSNEYYSSEFIEPVTYAAVKKSYLEGKDINDIDWQNDKNVLKHKSILKSGDYARSSTIENLKIDYKIVGITDSEIIIHRSAEAYEFKDKNKPDSIQHFEYKGDVTLITK